MKVSAVSNGTSADTERASAALEGHLPGRPAARVPHDAAVAPDRRQGDPAQEPEPDLLPDQRRRTRGDPHRRRHAAQAGLRLVLSLLPRSRALPGARRHAVRHAARRRSARRTIPPPAAARCRRTGATTTLHIVSQSSPTGTQCLQAIGCAEAGRLYERVTDIPDREEHFTHDEVTYVSLGDGSDQRGRVLGVAERRLPDRACRSSSSSRTTATRSPSRSKCRPPAATSRSSSPPFPDLLVRSIDGTDFPTCYRTLREAVDYVRDAARSGARARPRHPPVLALAVRRRAALQDAGRAGRRSAARSDRAARRAADVGRAWPATADLRRSPPMSIARSTRPPSARCAPRSRPSTPSASTSTRPTSTRRRPAFATEPVPDGKPDTMVAAINRTLKDEMARNPRIVVFGEDVADCSRPEALACVSGKGGVFKVTHGLQRAFGDDRVFNSPLAEAAIVGRATGMATRGIKPVVEIQFFDYIWPAMMQIRDEMSMLRYRSNNTFSCPMVIRVADRRLPARRRAVPQPVRREHLRALPGHPHRVPVERAGRGRPAAHGDPLRRPGASSSSTSTSIARPTTRASYPGPDYMVPFGKSAVRREGSDVVVITYGALVQRALLAAQQAEKDGISAMVIDLRTIAPFDWDGIAAAVKRTNRVVIAHEDQLTCGFGAELAARIAEQLFEHLDAPVKRVAAMDVPVAVLPRARRGDPAAVGRRAQGHPRRRPLLTEPRQPMRATPLPLFMRPLLPLALLAALLGAGSSARSARSRSKPSQPSAGCRRTSPASSPRSRPASRSPEGEYFVFDRRAHAVFAVAPPYDDGARARPDWRRSRAAAAAERVRPRRRWPLRGGRRARATRGRIQLFLHERRQRRRLHAGDARRADDGVRQLPAERHRVAGVHRPLDRHQPAGARHARLGVLARRQRVAHVRRRCGRPGRSRTARSTWRSTPACRSSTRTAASTSCSSAACRCSASTTRRGALLFERHIEGPELDDYVRTLPNSWPRRRTDDGELPIVQPAVRAAAADADGNLWISLTAPFTYVYDGSGDKRRTIQFRAAGVMSPTLALLHARPARAGDAWLLCVSGWQALTMSRAVKMSRLWVRPGWGSRACRRQRTDVDSADRVLSIRWISATRASGRHGLVTNESHPACRAPSAWPASA